MPVSAELDELVRPELSPELAALRFRTLGAAFRVHTALGPAMKESVYQQCFAHALDREGLHYQREATIDVEFDGLALPGALRPDFIIEGAIVVEVKAADTPLSVWNAQLLSYMWHAKIPFGYVINFRVPRLKQGITPRIESRHLPNSLRP